MRWTAPLLLALTLATTTPCQIVTRGPAVWETSDTSFLVGFKSGSAAVGEVEWALSKRTTIKVSDRFLRFRSIQRLNELDDIDPTVEVGLSRSRFTRKPASLAVTHLLDSRNRVGLYASHLIWDYSDDDRSDFELMSVNAFYSHQWDSRTRVGVSSRQGRP